MINSKHTKGLPELFSQLKVSLILSSNSSHKIIVINSDGQNISQIMRNIDKPMGIALYGNKLAIAGENHIHIFKQDSFLAKTYPNKANIYDTLFYPMVKHLAYHLDFHDLAYTKYGLVAVVTKFNLLAAITTDGDFSVKPLWMPPFIGKIRKPKDFCHLNGMATDDKGEIRYLTAFSADSEGVGWKNGEINRGVLIDFVNNSIVNDNLSMPHSPRIHQGELYLLSSASEELLKYNSVDHSIETIIKIDGFLRGLSFYGDYAFVGVSRVRSTHFFGHLSLAQKSIRPGVVVVKLSSRKIVGELVYERGVDELFDLKIISNVININLLTEKHADIHRATILPNLSNWFEEP